MATGVIELIDSYTKESVNYVETTIWHDGSPMSDAKVDNAIFRKKGSKYYVRQFTGGVRPEWFGDCSVIGSDMSDAIQQAVFFAENYTTHKTVLLHKKYTISKPIYITKRCEIIGLIGIHTSESYTITANNNFNSEVKKDGYDVNVTISSIFAVTHPCSIKYLSLNGNSVCENGIQGWKGENSTSGWMSGSITDSYFTHFERSAIFIQGCEHILISNNFIEDCKIGIQSSSYRIDPSNIYNVDNTVPGISTCYQIKVDNNYIMRCNYGILALYGGDHTFTSNITAHCQIAGIRAVGIASLNIRDCYSEGDGVCSFSIGNELDNTGGGTQPVGNASPYLINHNYDGINMLTKNYRAPYIIEKCSNVSVTDSLISVKKRGNINNLDTENWSRNLAGVDALVVSIRNENFSIRNIEVYDWNSGMNNTCNVYGVIHLTHDNTPVVIEQVLPKPILIAPNNNADDFIQSYPNVQADYLIRSNNSINWHRALSFSKLAYSDVVDDNIAYYTKGFDINSIFYNKIGNKSFWKLNKPVSGDNNIWAAFRIDATELDNNTYYEVSFQAINFNSDHKGSPKITAIYKHSNGSALLTDSSNVRGETNYTGGVYTEKLNIRRFSNDIDHIILEFEIYAANTNDYYTSAITAPTIRQLGDEQLDTDDSDYIFQKRPTLTQQDAGYNHFDSTLKKPIVWQGIKWTDFSGTDV